MAARDSGGRQVASQILLGQGAALLACSARKHCLRPPWPAAAGCRRGCRLEMWRPLLGQGAALL
eukprot:1009776-Pyramimonas_sp.AAC.1